MNSAEIKSGKISLWSRNASESWRDSCKVVASSSVIYEFFCIRFPFLTLATFTVESGVYYFWLVNFHLLQRLQSHNLINLSFGNFALPTPSSPRFREREGMRSICGTQLPAIKTLSSRTIWQTWRHLGWLIIRIDSQVCLTRVRAYDFDRNSICTLNC